MGKREPGQVRKDRDRTRAVSAYARVHKEELLKQIPEDEFQGSLCEAQRSTSLGSPEIQRLVAGGASALLLRAEDVRAEARGGEARAEGQAQEGEGLRVEECPEDAAATEGRGGSRLDIAESRKRHDERKFEPGVRVA